MLMTTFKPGEDEATSAGRAVARDEDAPPSRRRLRILVSAFACEPGKGSEAGMGWGTVRYLSQNHDVTALVAPMYRETIERFVAQNPMPNVRWVYPDLPRWFPFRDRLKAEPPRIFYYFWQHFALHTARELHHLYNFDVSHHITYGCYWRPSFLARLDVPFVWGPVGGAQRVPMSFMPTLPFLERLFVQMKIVSEWISITFDPSVRWTARRADVAIATTPIGVRRMLELGAKRVLVTPQVGLPKHDMDDLGRMPVRIDTKPFRFISLGRLLGWKGIHLGLRAFADMKRFVPDAEYWHVGDGEMADHLEREARVLGVADSFKVVRGKNRKQAFELLAQCDALMFPGFHDEPGWVVIEGMAAGRPVLVIRGLPDCPDIRDACLETRSDNPDNAVKDLARNMLLVARDQDLRVRMGEAGRRIARRYCDMEAWFGRFEQILEAAALRKADQLTPAVDFLAPAADEAPALEGTLPQASAQKLSGAIKVA